MVESTNEKAPKTEKLTEEQEISFMKEFLDIKTREHLLAYEQENRARLFGATHKVFQTFDRKWQKVMERTYVNAPAGTVGPTPTDRERIDPKSKNYVGFWEVIFSPKGRPDDPEDVMLSVNGQCLQIKRNIPVILPGPFLECCDHGVYPQYHQLPDPLTKKTGRKLTSWVKHFPYTIMREATEEEYLAMKAEGDRITREARRQEEED